MWESPPLKTTVCISSSTFTCNTKQTWPQANLILIPHLIYFWQLWSNPKEQYSTKLLANPCSSLRQDKFPGGSLKLVSAYPLKDSSRVQKTNQKGSNFRERREMGKDSQYEEKRNKSNICGQMLFAWMRQSYDRLQHRSKPQRSGRHIRKTQTKKQKMRSEGAHMDLDSSLTKRFFLMEASDISKGSKNFLKMLYLFWNVPAILVLVLRKFILPEELSVWIPFCAHYWTLLYSLKVLIISSLYSKAHSSVPTSQCLMQHYWGDGETQSFYRNPLLFLLLLPLVLLYHIHRGLFLLPFIMFSLSFPFPHLGRTSAFRPRSRSGSPRNDSGFLKLLPTGIRGWMIPRCGGPSCTL